MVHGTPAASDPRLRGLRGITMEAGGILRIATELARHKTDRQRQAVVLRHIEGLANPEIAQIMELGIEAVESLTARGKRALTAILAGRKADLGYDDDADEREAV